MIHSACNADDRFRTPACAPRLIEEELTDHVIQLGAVPLDVSLEGRHLMGYRSDAAGRFGHGALKYRCPRGRGTAARPHQTNSAELRLSLIQGRLWICLLEVFWLDQNDLVERAVRIDGAAYVVIVLRRDELRILA